VAGALQKDKDPALRLTAGLCAPLLRSLCSALSLTVLATVLGPCALRFARADARNSGRFGWRAPHRASDTFRLAAERHIIEFVRRNGCRQEKFHLRADLLLLHLKVIVPPRMPLCLASLQSYARQLMSPCAEDLRKSVYYVFY